MSSLFSSLVFYVFVAVQLADRPLRIGQQAHWSMPAAERVCLKDMGAESIACCVVHEWRWMFSALVLGGEE